MGTITFLPVKKNWPLLPHPYMSSSLSLSLNSIISLTNTRFYLFSCSFHDQLVRFNGSYDKTIFRNHTKCSSHQNYMHTVFMSIQQSSTMWKWRKERTETMPRDLCSNWLLYFSLEASAYRSIILHSFQFVVVVVIVHVAYQQNNTNMMILLLKIMIIHSKCN